MTRIAIIADIHADFHALEDALDKIDQLGCDLVVCAGDVIGWGKFPEQTISLVRERDITCIRGNHENWALQGELHDDPDLLLKPQTLKFLRSLPQSWSGVFDGVRVAVWHARPGSDMDGIHPDMIKGSELRRMLEEAEADVLVVGHNHIPFFISVPGGGIVVNPGALLRDPAVKLEYPWILDPKTGSFTQAQHVERGTFGVLETPAVRFRVCRAEDGVAIDGYSGDFS